jgi:aconitate hydratase
MAPEYGATCGFFGVDDKTLDYLRLTGRSDDQVALVEAYAKEQGLWLDAGMADPIFTDTLELDMSSVEPSLAGPKRPQDKVLLSQVDEEFRRNFTTEYGHPAEELPDRFPIEDSTGGGIGGAIAGLLGPSRATISATATSSLRRSRAAPTRPTPRCWSPPASSPARRASAGWIPSRG